MFSKAKRFEIAKAENEAKESKGVLPKVVTPKPSAIKPKITPVPVRSKSDMDYKSHNSANSKIFVTPKPIKAPVVSKPICGLKKPLLGKFVDKKPTVPAGKKTLNCPTKAKEDQDAEIRTKATDIAAYENQIAELKNQIEKLQLEMKNTENKVNENANTKEDQKDEKESETAENEDLKDVITKLEERCNSLEQEVSNKQVELSSLEGIICIRDSLCKDLQDKLTSVETSLEETRQRLEMVKGHHALALEANESIRREYKAELETMKTKLEDEKQAITHKCKLEQDAIKLKYSNQIELIKKQLTEEKDAAVLELQEKIRQKDNEMKAKLEQIDEATNEKLKLCEIQFEERFHSFQEHWSMQDEKFRAMEQEASNIKYSLSLAEEKNLMLTKDIQMLKKQNDALVSEKLNFLNEMDSMKEETKRKCINFDNEINKLTVEVENAIKEKNKYEMSLYVTRDIVQVLSSRMRESDNELELLEEKIQSLTDAKNAAEDELATYKNSLKSTMLERNEYKEALENILKSKAALAKEHNRIMEHNVSLIESLQNVEKEAFRELGSIKNEMIEDVEMIKRESKTQIQSLRDEVERRRSLCSAAMEQATTASAAAEQARSLLAHAAAELARLEAENARLSHQIQDQQSLVVELSLLRQENEDLQMSVAKQNSIIDKIRKDMEIGQNKPKSPSVIRKNLKIGKENSQILISPLRERNH